MSPSSSRVCSSSARERLVHQQDLRLGGERARDRDALAHAAGQLGRVAVLEAVEADQLDEVRRRARCACAFGMPAISSGKATFSITVRHGKVDSSWNTMPIEACGPGTVSPRDRDAALVAVEQPADDVEQGRLAAAGRADHREEFARRTSNEM